MIYQIKILRVILCKNKDHISKFHGLWDHDVYLLDMIKGSLQTVARAETGELRGGALYRGILSEILFGKGTTNSGRYQINSGENSENLQGDEDVRFSIILGNKKTTKAIVSLRKWYNRYMEAR